MTLSLAALVYALSKSGIRWDATSLGIITLIIDALLLIGFISKL